MNPSHTIIVTKQHKNLIIVKREWRLFMSSRNRLELPEAREAMDNFKFEVASELGVPLKHGYNGDLTSYQNGSVGGYMVKKMVEDYEKRLAGK